MRMIRVSVAVLAATLTAVALANANASDESVARAGTTTCAYDPATRVVTMHFVYTPDEFVGIFQPYIERDGAEIVFKAKYNERLVCAGGTPTVNNTDRIDLTQSGEVTPVLMTMDLLQGGPLAPGATPEASGRSEIEIESYLPDFQLEITPTDKPEHFVFGESGSDLRANLNAQEKPDDVDIVFHNFQDPGHRDFALSVATYTGREKSNLGNDTYSADGGAGTGGVFPYDVLLVGGKGRDLLTGGDGGDTIYGGEDPDRLFGGDGRDRINSLGAQRDLVDCGPDRDRAESSDNDDVRHCEKIAHSN